MKQQKSKQHKGVMRTIAVAMAVFMLAGLLAPVGALANTVVGDNNDYVIQVNRDHGVVGEFRVEYFNTGAGSGSTITFQSHSGYTNINTAGTSAISIGNTTAGTTVTARGGNSTLSVANNNSRLATTNSGMRVTEIGATNILVNANGQMTTGATTERTASLTVANTSGNTHGLVVQESKTTISGGTNSTSLTLDDSGARFANVATGAPVKVTGVADGTTDFDAVNWRQLKGAYAGIASVAALAAIPAPAAGHRFSVGMGYGNFKSMHAIAVGVKAAIAKNISATLGLGYNDNSKETVNAGIGFSW